MDTTQTIFIERNGKTFDSSWISWSKGNPHAFSVDQSAMLASGILNEEADAS